MSIEPVVIIGAGPAGLGAAYESIQHNIQPVILEKNNKIGGLAKTESYKGYLFDLGGHRFFTKVEKIHRLWQEMLGDDFLKVARKSSIYYQGYFFKYPPEFFDVLSKLGIIECLLIILSYFKSQLRCYQRAETFEQWVSNNFGRRFYKTFFQKYTEKVWGIPCNRIKADWAAQRIKGLSLVSVIFNLFFRRSDSKSLISEFYYPRKGSGMMWERFQEMIETGGGQIKCNTEVISVKHKNRCITHIIYNENDEKVEIPVGQLISSIPINKLVAIFNPKVPDEVLQAASKLSFRTHISVGLIINKENIFQDQWIYVHNQDVKVARIQNIKNWSSAMVPDIRKTSIVMEYYCSEGDKIKDMPDSEMIELASRELSELKLAKIDEVMDGFVIQQYDAYPIYDLDYTKKLSVIRNFLKSINNLQTIGRNGLYKYNNMDHSMYTGMLSIQNLFGADHDLWKVNEG
ncbi:FAD-dependent oxidoreductase [Candidatus Latescibacterota bacterium]